MKKILTLLLALLAFTSTANAQETEAQAVKSLMGLGMPGALATEVASIASGGVFANQSILPDTDNSLDLGSTTKTWRSLYTGTSIIAKTSQILRVEQDPQRLFTWDGASDVALTMTFGDAGTTAVQQLTISASTADADDDSSLILAGGGAAGGTRGASITLPGEEVSGGSDITYNAGTSDTHIFQVAGTTAETIAAASITAATGVDLILTSGSIFGSAVNKPWVNGLAAVPADVTTISTPEMLIFNGTSGGAGLITAQGAADANGTNNSFLKSRSTDGSADTIVQNGDIISQLTFYGANGATFDTAARIKVTVGGVPGASADMPGAIDFQTSADASATPASALLLGADKSATFTGIIKSTITNVGWQIRAGANTACTTTCTASHGCLFGQDTGSANIAVDCTNAAADVCVCSF